MASCAVPDANGYIRIEQSIAALNCNYLIVLNKDEYVAIVKVGEPFDYAQAATLWSFALSSVLLCWFIARGAGTILGLIRKG